MRAGGNPRRSLIHTILQDPTGSYWFLTGSYRILLVSTCSLLDPTGSYWFLLVPTGSHWILQDPTGSYRFLTGSYRFLLVPTRFPTGSHWILLDPIGSYWILHVPTGSLWFLHVYLQLHAEAQLHTSRCVAFLHHSGAARHIPRPFRHPQRVES